MSFDLELKSNQSRLNQIAANPAGYFSLYQLSEVEAICVANSYFLLSRTSNVWYASWAAQPFIVTCWKAAVVISRYWVWVLIILHFSKILEYFSLSFLDLRSPPYHY